MKEYRIGNHVQARSPEVSKFQSPVVLCASYMRMLARSNPGIVVKPIRLNIQHFIDYSFEKSVRMIPNTRASIVETISRGKLIIDIVDGKFLFNHIGGVSELKHFHQLQNLYFLVNEKELV